MASVTVSKFKSTLPELKIPELQELFKISKMPLMPTSFSIEIKGVNTSVVNAIRRVLIDEIQWYALTVEDQVIEPSSDSFMIPEFVHRRIEMLRLRPGITSAMVKSLKFCLNVSNMSPEVKYVYAGDIQVVSPVKLDGPIFNPTTEIAFLQPGKSINIKNIYIQYGRGIIDGAKYNMGVQCAFKHLDLAEHSDFDMRHKDGSALHASGYVEKCTVTKPMHHQLSGVIPATLPSTDIKKILSDVCDNIRDRLRNINSVLSEKQTSTITYSAVLIGDNLTKSVLTIPGETPTIGMLLVQYTHELAPDVSFINYTIHSDKKLILTLQNLGDTTKLLMSVVEYVIKIFNAIDSGIKAL